MERENYRINLEGVLSAFPDEPFPAIRTVAKRYHLNVQTLQADKDFMKLCRVTNGRTRITRESLAHWISGK